MFQKLSLGLKRFNLLFSIIINTLNLLNINTFGDTLVRLSQNRVTFSFLDNYMHAKKLEKKHFVSHRICTQKYYSRKILEFISSKRWQYNLKQKTKIVTSGVTSGTLSQKLNKLELSIIVYHLPPSKTLKKFRKTLETSSEKSSEKKKGDRHKGW